jgi:hypothetical protein
MPICNNKWKSLQRLMICVNQNYSGRFVEMHNLAKKIRNSEVRMGEGTCQFKSSFKEIEYFDEGKVIFFLEFFVLNNFYSIHIVHDPTFFFFCRFANKVIFFQ